jgi:tetratricopeptide (TPR) repeat protein
MNRHAVSPAHALILIIFCASAFISCKSPEPVKSPIAVITIKPRSNHPNLRRFGDNQIDQIVINAWENFQNKKYEQAALDFERLIKKKYSDDDIYFGAGISFYHYSDLKKAALYTMEALKLNPAHFEAMYLMASIQRSMKNPSVSRKYLENVISCRYEKKLICGYYFDEDDIADGSKLKGRQEEASRMLGK